jgi:hypothetical protein
VGAIAEGFILGVAAAAQADDGATAQSERFALHIGNGVFAFDPDGAVGVDGNFRWHFIIQC